MNNVTVNGITYIFEKWEPVDDIFIHIFTEQGIICVPIELVNFNE